MGIIKRGMDSKAHWIQMPEDASMDQDVRGCKRERMCHCKDCPYFKRQEQFKREAPARAARAAEAKRAAGVQFRREAGAFVTNSLSSLGSFLGLPGCTPPTTTSK